MSFFDAIVLGIVQGLTEFLPVSSSGHLVIAERLLGVTMPGIFVEVMLHLATLLAVVFVYRRRLGGLLAGVFRGDRDAWKYALLLVLATIPAGLIGVLFKDWFESVFDAPAVAGWMLLVTGVLLFSTRFVEHRREEEGLDPAKDRLPDNRPDTLVADEAANAATADRATRDLDRPIGAGRAAPPDAVTAFIMGCLQAFAILPGISRSGSTITAGLWRRLDGERAAEFSFLMSIPAILGAVVLQMGDAADSVHSVGLVPLAAGFLAALISGVLAIKWLVWLVRREAFHRFAYYVFAAGIAFLLYLAF